MPPFEEERVYCLICRLSVGTKFPFIARTELKFIITKVHWSMQLLVEPYNNYNNEWTKIEGRTLAHYKKINMLHIYNTI